MKSSENSFLALILFVFAGVFTGLATRNWQIGASVIFFGFGLLHTGIFIVKNIPAQE